MQTALCLLHQEAASGLQTKDRVLQLLANLLKVLKHQKHNKPDIPPSTVSTISSVLCCNTQDACVALLGLKCLQQVVRLLSNAPPVMRLEGGLRAVLVVLQSPSMTRQTAILCAHLLTQLSTASRVTLVSLVDMGASQLLLNTLQLFSKDAALSAAVLQLLLLIGKAPKGAVSLSELQLLPAVANLLSEHEGNVSICGFALKLLKRVAKQPACREALARAGAQQLLLDCAHCMAALEGQQQQVKRASRAIWLLKSSSLTPLPSQQPYWAVPGRSAPHLTLADAMGDDVQRLQELFPELQAAFTAAQAAGAQTAAVCCVSQECDVAGGVGLTKGPAQVHVMPLSVEELMQQGPAVPEPFRPDTTHMAAIYMLKDLSRLDNPNNLVNQVVYDSTQPAPVYLQHACHDSCVPASQLEADPSAAPSAAPGVLQFTSNMESGNLRMAVHVRNNEYDLFLSNDLNDRSLNKNSCQWFYFGVCNAQPGASYKFNLVNLHKPDSLYATCKQPHMCRAHSMATGQQPPQRGLKTDTALQASTVAEVGGGITAAAAAGLGACQGGMRCSAVQHFGACSTASCWHRVGQNVCYYPSPYRGRTQGSGDPTLPSLMSCSTSQEKGSMTGSRGDTNNSPSKHSKSLHAKRVAKKKPQAACSPTTADSIPSKRSSSRRANADINAIASTAGDEADCTAAPLATQLLHGDDSDNGVQRSAATPGPGLYCLTFEVTFPCSGMYLICNCYPYTYSDLQQQLANVELRFSKMPPAQVPVVRSLLCYTLAKQRCDLLTITDFNSSAADLARRVYVVISARVHPGETCASWIMQGVIEFLLSSDPAAERLRRYFVFKLIPMLNPDGVVVGNYRSSLAGTDLNRCWDKAVREVHPTIFHARKLLEAVAEPGRLALTIDIHGHSCSTDAFFYGCEPLLNKPAKAQQADSTAADTAGMAGADAGTTSSCRDSRLFCSTSSADQLCVTGTAVQPADSRSGIIREVSGQPRLPAPVPWDMEPAFVGHAASGLHAAAAAGIAPQAGTVVSMGDVNAVSKEVDEQQGLITGGGVTSEPTASSSSTNSATSTAAATSLTAAAAARLRVRMLPFLAAQLHPAFAFSKCSFKVQKSKAGTARVVAARQLGIPGAYTLEASLAGSSTSGHHFGVYDYLEIGKSLMLAVGQLAESDDQMLLGTTASSVNLPTLPS